MMSDSPRTQPSLTILHLSFLFSGAGTLLCGPLLPAFAQQWHLRDSQSGLLIGAQFLGLFVGAIALSANLRLTLLWGYVVAGSGFLALGLASQHAAGYYFGLVAFFVLGLGLGQVTTTVNLLSALRYPLPQQRSAALSLLNFTWSVGAVLAPLIAGVYMAHANLFSLLTSFAIWGIGLTIFARRNVPALAPGKAAPTPAAIAAISLPSLVYFFAIFFLYGGFEATVAGWLSTYTYRYTGLGMAAAAYVSTTLWAAFAAGRAIAGGLLRIVPEWIVLVVGMLLAVLASVALRAAHTGTAIAICATFAGLGMGPFFPVVFSRLIVERPSPRQAGAATSNIALGSACIPYLTGVLSTRFGSLHTAMLAPVVIGFGVLILAAIRLGERPVPQQD